MKQHSKVPISSVLVTMICNSSSNEHHLFGISFLIHKRVKGHTLNFQPLDERTGYFTLKGKFVSINIICLHAPAEDNDDMVKSSYCDRIDRVYQTIPKHDAVTVTGDMNAKVGKDALTPCTGKYSLHEISNDKGERLPDKFQISLGLHSVLGETGVSDWTHGN
jgi:hypothetical protein